MGIEHFQKGECKFLGCERNLCFVLLTFQLQSVANASDPTSRETEVSEMKATIEQIKNDLETLKSIKTNETPVSVVETNSSKIMDERKMFEKNLIDKLKKMSDEMSRTFSERFDRATSDISDAIFRNVSRDFAAKTDNGTDVMKGVYSVIHSLGEGLKRSNGKQRMDGAAINRFLNF